MPIATTFCFICALFCSFSNVMFERLHQNKSFLKASPLQVQAECNQGPHGSCHTQRSKTPSLSRGDQVLAKGESPLTVLMTNDAAVVYLSLGNTVRCFAQVQGEPPS